MRSRRAAINFVSGFLRNFIGLLIAMVSTPIILGYLGEERFGIMRVLMDWFAHLGLAEFGLFAAVMSVFSRVLGEKRSEMGAVFRTSFQKYRFVLFTQLMAIGVFAIFFEYLVPVSPELQREVWICFLILSVTSLAVLSQVFKAYLEAAQRGYISSYIMLFQQIVNVVLTIALVAWGYSIVGQALAFAVSTLLCFGIYAWVCRAEIRLALKSLAPFSDEVAFRRQRASQFANEMCGRVCLFSDNLIITFVIGTKEVTAFYLTQRLIQIAQAQLQQVSNSSWAALGELYYQKNFETFRTRVLQLTEVTAYLSGSVLSVLVLFNRTFISLWIDDVNYAGDWVANLAAVNAGFLALNSLWVWCFTATNKMDKIVSISIFHAIVNVLFSFWFTSRYGLTGPLWGTVIGYAASIGWICYVLCKTFDISMKRLHQLWVIPFFLPLGLTIAGAEVFGYPLLRSWWGLLFFGGLSTVLYLVGGYFFFVSRETRQFLIERIKKSRYFKTRKD